MGVQFKSHHKKPIMTSHNQTYPILLSTLLEPNWHFNTNCIIGFLLITWGDSLKFPSSKPHTL